MPRPTMDVHSPAYQEILKQRALYRQYGHVYPDMKQALDTLNQLEKKIPSKMFTLEDVAAFEKAKAIIKHIEDVKEEPRPTTHYIWRTQGDRQGPTEPRSK